MNILDDQITKLRYSLLAIKPLSSLLFNSFQQLTNLQALLWAIALSLKHNYIPPLRKVRLLQKILRFLQSKKAINQQIFQKQIFRFSLFKQSLNQLKLLQFQSRPSGVIKGIAFEVKYQSYDQTLPFSNRHLITEFQGLKKEDHQYGISDIEFESNRVKTE